MNLNDLKNKLVISCQAVDDEPLNDAYVIAKMAFACVAGGAEILRMSQVDHITKAKELVNVPIIGLIKKHYDNSEVFITPTMQEIDALAEIKVDVIALDATLRPRPDGKTIDELIVAAKNKYPNLLFMADCSNEEDVKHANELPFDLIGTTLRGHTKETNGKSNIADDFAFIKTILNFVAKPLIVEGGIWEPAQVKRAFAVGASTVVVGSAITRPKLIVEHWMKEIK